MERSVVSKDLASICIVVVCLAGLSACDPGPTAPSVALGQEFVLAPAERARLEGTPISIRFVGVVADSRCPSDVVCVQAGDAVVRIEIDDGGQRPIIRDLHVGSPGPAIDDGLAVTLLQLAPYPVSTKPTEPAEYRATLQATRAVLP